MDISGPKEPDLQRQLTGVLQGRDMTVLHSKRGSGIKVKSTGAPLSASSYPSAVQHQGFNTI